MEVRLIFGLSVLMSLVAFGLVARLYVLPWLRGLRRDDALVALMVPHAFRFIGLSFLMPGVVAPSLPAAFAVPAAYGDLVATVLAVTAILATIGGASWATGLVWLFNLWGAADLLYAYYQGVIGIPGFDPEALGAAFYLPTAIVPLFLVTHGLMVRLLLSRKEMKASGLRHRDRIGVAGAV